MQQPSTGEIESGFIQIHSKLNVIVGTVFEAQAHFLELQNKYLSKLKFNHINNSTYHAISILCFDTYLFLTLSTYRSNIRNIFSEYSTPITMEIYQEYFSQSII